MKSNSVPLFIANVFHQGVAQNAPIEIITRSTSNNKGVFTNNKNPRNAVLGAVAAHLIQSNTNAAIVRGNITTATQNSVSNVAHLLVGNAANNVVVSGLYNSAMPTHTQTQFVKLVGQGVAIK